MEQRSDESNPQDTPLRPRDASPVKTPKVQLKLGFKEKRELDALPTIIEGLESEQEELFHLMADPELYKKERADIIGMNDRLEELKRLLADAYTRWEHLEQVELNAISNRLSELNGTSDIN